MKTGKFLPKIAVVVCLLCLILSAAAQTKKRKPVRRSNRSTAAATAATAAANAAQVRAEAEKVSAQIVNVTRFLYLLGGSRKLFRMSMLPLKQAEHQEQQLIQTQQIKELLSRQSEICGQVSTLSKPNFRVNQHSSHTTHKFREFPTSPQPRKIRLMQDSL